MSAPCAALAAALLSIAAGCGGASKGANPTTGTKATATVANSATTGALGWTSSPDEAARLDIDGDVDARGSKAFYDADDTISHFGHAAGRADEQAVTATVTRYYKAAAGGDGEAVCSLIAPTLAAGLLARSSQASDAKAPYGSSCPGVLVNLLKGSFLWSPADVASLAVVAVRVEGDRGYALMRLQSKDRQILVERDGGVWRMGALFDSLVT